MQPPAEHVHWLFATGFLLLALCLLARAVVGVGAWAQTMMLAGAAELGLVRGKLHNRAWRLCLPLALAVSGVALLVHEQNGWYFSRAAFLHHALGWTALIGAFFPLMLAVRPRARVWGAGLAVTLVLVSVFLYADRDVAPVFGH